MNTKPTPLDDLKIGDHVCVHSIRHDNPLPADSAPSLLAYRKESVAPLGWPLRILAFDFPFIFCQICHSPTTDLGGIIVDTRDFHLQRLSPSYVSAILSFTPRPPPGPCRHPEVPGQRHLPFSSPPDPPPPPSLSPAPSD